MEREREETERQKRKKGQTAEKKKEKIKSLSSKPPVMNLISPRMWRHDICVR